MASEVDQAHTQTASAWLKKSKVGFLGCGNMAQAMIRGFVKSSLLPAENIVVSATSVSSKNYQTCKSIGTQCTVDNSVVVSKAEIVFVAVKPHLVKPVLAACNIPKETLLISVAAGVKLDALIEASSNNQVVRAMPNTASGVQQGATVYAFKERQITPVQQAAVDLMLSSLGFCRCVPESLIEPISAVSGSGIAFLYMTIEAMADAGVKAGVPRQLAYELASQTMAGAAAMVQQTGEHPGALKDAVCSPGGSTIAGVHALEKAGFRGAMMEGIEATVNRVKQLG